MNGRIAGAALVLAVLLSACGGSTSESPSTSSDIVDPDDYSVAYKLAAIHGDPSAEAEFQQVLDCIKASGIEGAETEEQIADTLVAGWEESSKVDTLLEWSRAFC